jgi:3-deoxy-D-manno-octulosonic-acid transferase
MYRKRIYERFSLSFQPDSQSVDVWLHAVSLGEVVAATPLISELLLKKREILVTTMTPTGSQQIINYFDKKVRHQYVPYDLPRSIRRFLKQYKPRLGIIMETELWPNIIHEATHLKIPLILANARMSDQSFKSYNRLNFIFKPVLNQFSAIFTQTPEDSQKFITVGAAASIVHMLGNIKFDLQCPPSHIKKNDPLKNQWGSDRVVLILASTHYDEELQFLSRLPQLRAIIPNLLLLIAPRHPERFQSVYESSMKEGFVTALRTREETIDATIEVVVVDSLGELLRFYQCADYAFVGGSLVPVGGHNVLEPIAMGVPVFCGPFMGNSRVICRDLCAAGALVMVKNTDDFCLRFVELHENKNMRAQQISNATVVLSANRGALARFMEKIEVFFP